MESGMSKSVKTTRIEKKYQDKKTGEWKSITIDYAKVVDRLNEFRSEHPRSKILTNHKVTEDGNVIFKAYLWKDKTEFLELLKGGADSATALLSADSEGTSEHAKDDEKKFEKLETIAVGRALALLGYAGSGEIASTEEMEEFENFKLEKLETAIESIKKATKRDEFQTVMSGLNAEQQKQITPIIKERMAELKKEVQHAG